MNKIKLAYCALILTACISSCHVDSLILPMHKSTRLGAIAKLPANQQIQKKEMKDWFAANLQTTVIEPQWENAIQTFHDGNHVIEVPTGTHSALFFTKVKGVLKVDAYRWKDLNVGVLPFSGDIIYYSFSKAVAIGVVANQGTVTRSKSFDIPKDEPLIPLFDTLITGNIWPRMKLH
jgi:hypothetical protein